MRPFDYTVLRLVGCWDPENRFNHTSWVASSIIIPTDRPKSVRNRCVDLSVGEGAFVVGLSHIASFFS